MSLKFSPPDSYDFHAKVYSRIKHGNIQRVGDATHKHRSQLSREWNPDEPQNSALYEACLELAAWKQVQPEIFELQAEAVSDVIVTLRAGGGPLEANDMELKRLCDGVTTALLSQSGEDKESAMVRLHAFLDARLRRDRGLRMRLEDVA